jgi:hypothetical protein
MLLSGDIMGIASLQMESAGSGVALFINGPAGDIQPQNSACKGAPSFVGSKILSDAVATLRTETQTTTDIEIETKSVIVSFGKTDMNLTLERVSNCTSGGFLDICGICKFLDCDLNLHLGPEWLQEEPRFTAIKMKVAGTKFGMVTIPGEAIQELGFQIRSDIIAAGCVSALSNAVFSLCAPFSQQFSGSTAVSFWATARLIWVICERPTCLLILCSQHLTHSQHDPARVRCWRL